MPNAQTVETGFVGRCCNPAVLKPALVSASISRSPVRVAVCSVAPLFQGCTLSATSPPGLRTRSTLAAVPAGAS